MAKMTAEEKHKKQLEKLKAKQSTDASTEYTQPRSEKEKAIEELGRKGFKAEYSNGTPIFHVTNQKDVDTIKDKMASCGSFGFRYSQDLDLKFD